MAIEKRGPRSWRAKVFEGKTLIMQKRFATKAEALRFEKIEKAKLTVAAQQEHRAAQEEERRDYWRMANDAATQASTCAVPPDIGKVLWQGWCRDAEGRSYKLPDQEIRRHKAEWGIKWEPTGKAEPEEDARVMTLGEIVTRYRDEVTPTHRGEKQETSRLNDFLKYPLVKKLIADIRKSNFIRWRDDRARDPDKRYRIAEEAPRVNPLTVNTELTLWHSVIEHAREEQWIFIAENPAHVKHIRVPGGGKRDRRFQGNEETRLLESAALILRDAIIVLSDTAMRAGELTKLRPSMLCGIDGDMSYIVLPKSLTKTTKAREIALTARAHEVLARRAKAVTADGLLFEISANALSTRFRKLREKLGIANLRVHDMRHEGTSRFCETRLFNQAEVMSMTGHESDAMFRRYLKPLGVELAGRLRRGTVPGSSS